MHFNNWTLFLDRDGTINKRWVGDYVQNWEQFEFLPGVLEAIAGFSTLFGKICIVTNQQGIGKGKMSAAQLHDIHTNMKAVIASAGGRIDGIYYCPHLSNAGCTCRKPLPGLALQAQQDFPEINFSRSVMVGDMMGDLQFGVGLNMITVQVGHEIIDGVLPDIKLESLQALWHQKNQLRLLALKRNNRS